MARLSSISIGWNAFLRSPVLGEGFLAGSSNLMIAIHSVPVRVLASYGVIGGIFYVLVIGGLLFGFLRRIRPGESLQRVISFGAFSVVLVAIFDASTHSSGLLFYDIAQPAVFGALLGLTADRSESGQSLAR
jgi:O-antigen ligase